MAMMNKKKKLMTTAIAGSMAAAIVVGGGTFAFLQSQTDDVVNNFKTEQVEVEISETPNDYDIIPGTEQDKDPSVTIKNTLDSYLFVKITDNTDNLVTYDIAEGWTELEGYKGIYYRKVAPKLDDEGNVVEQKFDVLKDNKVSYDKELVNEDMLDAQGNLRTDVALTFTAYAIQQRPFTDSILEAKKEADEQDADKLKEEEHESARLAYLQAINATLVSTAEELQSVFSNAQDGEDIVVSIEDDIDLSEIITLKNDVTIIGNEKTITAAPGSSRIFNVDSLDEKITLDFSNVTLDATNSERCISLYNNSEGADIKLDNVEIIADKYAINVASYNGAVTLNAEDSTITGWCAYQSWSPDASATFKNCTLIGDNHFSKGNSNNFSTLVIYPGANNNSIFLENCTVEANQTTGNRQTHISIREKNATVMATDTIFKTDGAEDEAQVLVTSQEVLDTLTHNFE